jgi:hypothetical protein
MRAIDKNGSTALAADPRHFRNRQDERRARGDMVENGESRPGRECRMQRLKAARGLGFGNGIGMRTTVAAYRRAICSAAKLMAP